MSASPGGSGKDNKTEKVDPATSAGSAQEQVVVKDKRKIDSMGRPRPGQGEASPTDAGRPDVAMGQPGPDGTSMAGATAAGVAGDGADVPAGSAPESGIVEAEVVDESSAPVVSPTASTPVAGAGAGDAGLAGTAPTVPAAELAALRTELDERVRDLQRVTAEYANYRKRVERDRGAVVEQAVASVVTSLVPVLDDVDRAREHGDLVGPFAVVAEQVSAALAKFGLTGFGEVGDPFDPTRHEAVAHQTSAEVSEPTCVSVMRKGYLLGDRLVRPAMVAVADPE